MQFTFSTVDTDYAYNATRVFYCWQKLSIMQIMFSTIGRNYVYKSIHVCYCWQELCLKYNSHFLLLTEIMSAIQWVLSIVDIKLFWISQLWNESLKFANNWSRACQFEMASKLTGKLCRSAHSLLNNFETVNYNYITGFPFSRRNYSTMVETLVFSCHLGGPPTYVRWRDCWTRARLWASLQTLCTLWAPRASIQNLSLSSSMSKVDHLRNPSAFVCPILTS